MRLNSKQIYEEYLLDQELNKLGEDKKILEQAFNNVEKLTFMDLQSYETILRLIKNYPTIEEYCIKRLKAIEKNIIKQLQLSDDQWKKNIERLEDMKI